MLKLSFGTRLENTTARTKNKKNASTPPSAPFRMTAQEDRSKKIIGVVSLTMYLSCYVIGNGMEKKRVTKKNKN